MRARVYNHGIDHDIWRQRLQSEMGDFNSIASALQLHRLDARGSDIQANNRLRSESKHVPAFTVARQLSRLPSVSYCWRFKKSKLDQWLEDKSYHMEARSKKQPKAAVNSARLHACTAS